ncbi:MAG TPA: flagellar hook-basal body complex protein FliE [Steroidobacter sp.]|nr:flagellar hook-basal body complex protein FliE [Steroidobacteraceae bacterium]HLS80767.1 flagellar hook-basal body complex protein FliE [Steroidobacter sp.]
MRTTFNPSIEYKETDMAGHMNAPISASIAATLARIEADAQAMSESILPAAEDRAGGRSGGFVDSMRQAIDSVNAQDRIAGDKAADVISGRSDDLVGAMLASQQASLSFSMLMQVRNKVVGAMEDLIKMHI